MKRFLEGFALSFVLYALYVQFDKRMGNIWIRNDVENKSVFVPHNLISLILRPIYDIQMWNPYLWDINYFIFSSVATIGYMQSFNIFRFFRGRLSSNRLDL